MIRYFKDIDGGDRLYVNDEENKISYVFNTCREPEAGSTHWVDASYVWPLNDLRNPEYAIGEIPKSRFDSLCVMPFVDMAGWILFESTFDLSKGTLYAHKDGITFMLYKDDSIICGGGVWVDRSSSWKLEDLKRSLNVQEIGLGEFLSKARVQFIPDLIELDEKTKLQPLIHEAVEEKESKLSHFADTGSDESLSWVNPDLNESLDFDFYGYNGRSLVNVSVTHAGEMSYAVIGVPLETFRHVAKHGELLEQKRYDALAEKYKELENKYKALQRARFVRTTGSLSL